MYTNFYRNTIIFNLIIYNIINNIKNKFIFSYACYEYNTKQISSIEWIEYQFYFF